MIKLSQDGPNRKAGRPCVSRGLKHPGFFYAKGGAYAVKFKGRENTTARGASHCFLMVTKTPPGNHNTGGNYKMAELFLVLTIIVAVYGIAAIIISQQFNEEIEL